MTVASNLGQPWRIANDGADLFVTDRAGRVLRVSNGNATVLAMGQAKPGRIRVSGANVFWIDEGSSDGTGALSMVPKQGGMIFECATGLSQPYDLAVTSSSVFYTETGMKSGVSRVDLGADASTPISIATTYVPPMGIAVDTQIFFTTRDMAWPNAGNVY